MKWGYRRGEFESMISTYKCKGCGAPIEFDGAHGKLVCEYCGTQMSIEEMSKTGEEYDSTVEDETTGDANIIDVDGYKCQSCGAELITDADTTATVCAFCGSSAVIKGRLEGESMPAKIIPFEITKEKAKEIFGSWCKKGVFTPSMFKNSTFIESMQGIYVPFWLYDYHAGCHIDGEATKSRSHMEGEYRVTKTEHFHVMRDGEALFEKVPADASEKMPDETMDLLEPYNYGNLVDFKMPYLSGFMSEKYTFDSKEMAPRVEKRVRDYIFREVRNSINGYSTVSVRFSNTRLKRKKAMYTLIPVWMLTYRYKGETQILAINGQTGKQVGTLPKSKEKMLGWFGGIFAGVFAVLMLLGGFLG